MAQGQRQRLAFRRRRSGQTDYRRRLKLLRSGAPRAVVRISNTQTTAQLVIYKPDGDEVVNTIGGRNLLTWGWPEGMSQKSIPASYLIGYALGKSSQKSGHSNAVLDIGLAASTTGSRVFAALAGMVDSGLDIPHGKAAFPAEDRLSGAHISDAVAKAVESTKSKIEGAFE